MTTQSYSWPDVLNLELKDSMDSKDECQGVHDPLISIIQCFAYVYLYIFWVESPLL